jgi:hypothetical protein
MQELIRSADLVLISALKAALSAEGIPVFEFDGDIASIYGGLDAMPRRLMVLGEDFESAASVVTAMCPGYFT